MSLRTALVPVTFLTAFLAACACPIPHAPNLTRDSPHEALDFLAASIRARRPGLVYDSLHPRLVKTLGGFSVVELAASFDEAPGRFDRLADLLEEGARAPPELRPDGAAVIQLTKAGTKVTLLLARRDRAEATFDSEWTPVTRRDVPDAAATVTVGDDGSLSAGPVVFPGIRSTDAPDLIRLQIHRDWVLAGWRADDGRSLFGP